MRKSSRQPVPNPMYQQGITELKKQNTSRVKKKQKNNEESNASNEQEYNSNHNFQNAHSGNGKGQYLTCKMPGGTNLKIKFVIENRQEEKKKQRQKQKQRERQREKEIVVQTPKPTLKSNKPTNLLNLFFQAIQDADGPEKQLIEPAKIIHQQQPKQMNIKQKAIRNQGENFIKQIKIQNQTMKIVHSQFKQCKSIINLVEIPLEWQATEIVQEQDAEVEEIKKKLESCHILKNISILA